MGNKLVNKEIITVVWHFDDLNVTHKDSFEVTKLSKYMSTIYVVKLKVH